MLAAALEEDAEELRRTWVEELLLAEGVVALERVAAEEELRVADCPEEVVALERVALPLVALLRVAEPLVVELERVWEPFWVAVERV